MTTFIQAINQVLVNVGERATQQLNTPVTRLAAQTVADALEEMSLDHDWQHLRGRVNAVSWANETATLPQIVKLYNVGYQRELGNIEMLPFLHEEEFDSRQLFSSITGHSASYTYDGNNKVRVNPYPTTAPERAKFFFYVTRRIAQPTTLVSVLDLPDHLVPLLVKKASALMATRHTGDPRLAQGFANEYDRMLLRQRTVNQKVPAASTNMYRRGRNKWSGN
jgi:hypothetical protein